MQTILKKFLFFILLNFFSHHAFAIDLETYYLFRHLNPRFDWKSLSLQFEYKLQSFIGTLKKQYEENSRIKSDRQLNLNNVSSG
jgi:hypothetical protein